MQKIIPFLWFNNNAEEAMNFYTSVFPGATASNVSRYPEGGPMPAGTVLGATLDIYGQTFSLLNGGPFESFNHAISFFVNCETQEEIDSLWEKLLAGGGKEEQCGWLRDRFGVSWQIVPTTLATLMADPDPKKAKQTMEAMMKMVKLDIAALQAAHDA